MSPRSSRRGAQPDCWRFLFGLASLPLLLSVACSGAEVFPGQIVDDAGRLDWSHANDRIAFDHRRDDGEYDLSVVEPDGSGRTCLTCDRDAITWTLLDGLPAPVHHLTVGQPAWHPSGDWLIAQVEQEGHAVMPLGDEATNPGSGIFHELWLFTADGQEAWQLTDLPSDESGKDRGTLHPHFSTDGSQLCWSEMVDGIDWLAPERYAGSWVLKVADVNLAGPRPSLENVVDFLPGAEAVYECHGFSPDGERLIFSSPMEVGNGSDRRDVYTVELDSIGSGSLDLTRLTDADFNEHALFSPDGTRIAYMSSRDIASDNAFDWWVMDADGGNKTRLTWFNDPGHADEIEGDVVAADLSWAPDGTAFAGYFWRWRLGRGLDEIIVRVEAPR